MSEREPNRLDQLLAEDKRISDEIGSQARARFRRDTWDELAEIARAASVMVAEAGGRMEGQAWLDLRARLAASPEDDDDA